LSVSENYTSSQCKISVRKKLTGSCPASKEEKAAENRFLDEKQYLFALMVKGIKAIGTYSSSLSY
jgi:hypothetical protein